MMEIDAEIQTDVVVVGGGVAGVWTAYKLAKRGIRTLLITYSGTDRGGLQGATRQSVGAINTYPIDNEDFASYLDHLGKKQTHPAVSGTLQHYLRAEIAELASIIEMKPVKIGIALKSGSGTQFLHKMTELFQSLGGKVLDAWVTRLEVDTQTCRGLQYERCGHIGVIHCRAMVLASGGYSGLYSNSIKTNCYGTMLGRYLQAGGHATNLEFLFKHGYGNFDTNDLTPTEELPGAEIYDEAKVRVRVLEKLIFDGRGTTTHHQAVNLWMTSNDTHHFIDFTYRPLYLALRRCHEVACHDGLTSPAGEQAINEILEMMHEGTRPDVRAQLLNMAALPLDFEQFEALKPFVRETTGKKFRVNPLTYFCMGGIAHTECLTNLKNVFVNGECMHDFGANRVGGLPWGFYLANGQIVCNQIATCLQADASDTQFTPVDLPCRFDAGLLQRIRTSLSEFHERRFTRNDYDARIKWIRETRSALLSGDDRLSDGVPWLIVAEAILQSYVSRQESRGYFLRTDMPYEDPELDGYFSRVQYDAGEDIVTVDLLAATRFAAEPQSM
jgi:succinate dehydrogenase/fumarate reductase flavoprotein subunit